MINEISQEIRNVLTTYSQEDTIIFNNHKFPINKNNFSPILPKEQESIVFIDGGQAEILSAGNFCLAFIRVAAVVFNGIKKKQQIIKEFYLLTKAKYLGDIYYESKIFGDTLIDEQDLLISSNDASIKVGSERAAISKVANVARRFAELKLASEVQADFVVIDGTLDLTFKNEEKYLSPNLSALAKSSSLFTTSGNTPVVLLNKLGPSGCWGYFVEHHTHFVKLHEHSKHVFRFSGDKEVLSHFLPHCADALFLGYPYGLVVADKLARVSNQDKQGLTMKFLLRAENHEIAEYLTTTDVHGILDRLG